MRAPLIVAATLCAMACTTKVKPPKNVGPTVVAPQNLFLRNAFDADPSMYLGRFVPTGERNLDESSAMRLTCSQHISTRTIAGGGVQYDETFNASTEASAKIGVPLIANVGASGGASQVVRVKYELTEKLVAEIDDPAAFEACCKRAPDQCTELYIGEFIAGTGQVFYASGHNASLGGKGVTAQGVTGELDFKHGVAWERSITFPNPVYFAFKTTRNQWTGEGVAGGCGPWTDAPPRSSQGRYFVGISLPLPTEAEARDQALRSGREQVVRYIAEGIQTGTLSVRTTEGLSNALATRVSEEKVVETASSGVARLVKDEAWCVQPTPTPGGDIYVAKALMFLPASEEQAAVTALATAAGVPASEAQATP